MARVARWLGLAVWVAAAASGCGSALGTAGTAAASPPRGERIWRSKCGACHVPVAPQTRDRATLEKALARHRARVHLSEPEWSSVVDFLAARPSTTATSR